METSDVANSEIYLQDEVFFEQGKTYLIKANSGQGKSSLLNFIYGLNTAFDGEITYTETSDYTTRSQQKISYVFQDFKLFEQLTIWENILLKNEQTNHKTTTEIEQLLAQVGLLSKKDKLLAKLSLGQRQRVAIIRALCQPFEWLLLDEPFSHLDETNITILTQLITTELAQKQAGMILTSLGSDYLFAYDKIIQL